MIQRHGTLNYLCHKFNESMLKGGGLGFLQKAYTSAEFLNFSVRFNGKTLWVYLGRGQQYQGFWWLTQPLPSSLRRKDVLLDYFRKYLLGSSLLEIKLDDKDRILTFIYQKWGQKNYFSFFWKGRETFFAHYFYDNNEPFLNKSWEAKIIPSREALDINDFLDEFNELERINLAEKSLVFQDDSSNLLKMTEQISEYLDLKVTPAGNTPSKKQQNKDTRKAQFIEEDLLKVSRWKLLQEKMLLDMNYFPRTEELSLLKIKIPKDLTTLEQKRNSLFTKLKRWKGVEELLQNRLKNVFIKPSSQGVSLWKDATPIIHPFWGKLEKNKTQSKLESSIQKKSQAIADALFYQLPSNQKIAFGKRAKANDELRSKWASKEDWWFHLDGYPSSHAYLKNSGAGTHLMQPDLLSLIGSALLEISGLSGSEGTVLYTQVKNLKSVKGSPGLVIFHKEKRFYFLKTPSWSSLLQKIN